MGVGLGSHRVQVQILVVLPLEISVREVLFGGECRPLSQETSNQLFQNSSALFTFNNGVVCL